MSNIKSPISFDIFQTQDGSPTINIEGGEKMHSLQGALSESLYIYGSCLEDALKAGIPARILSMGLGLGYNEWISLAQLHSQQINEYTIHSFETLNDLNVWICRWLQGQKTPLDSVYNSVVGSVAEHFEIPFLQLKNFGMKSIQRKQWILNGPIETPNITSVDFTVIFYDAFSSKTDDGLWSDSHLTQFIDQYCSSSQCYFTTYAATGNLNRALKSRDFLIEKKVGFGNKRQSTRAIRQNDGA